MPQNPQVFIALMRGVNVGGHGKLPMADFRAMLKDMGLQSVQTYIQSGNAVFAAQDTSNLASKISAAVEARFGFSRPCLIRSQVDLDAAIEANPFPQAHADPKSLHLIFLSGDVEFDPSGLTEYCTAGEEFVLDSNVLYFYTPNGFGRSKAASKLDRFVKAQAMTARNLASCLKLQSLAAACAHALATD